MGELAIINRLLTAMLWSRQVADDVRAVLGPAVFGGRAALAALIHDHDLENPDGAAAGCERLVAIEATISAHAAAARRARWAREAWTFTDRKTPAPISPYTDAATSLNARSAGEPDPMLLAHAAAVLAYLPVLAVPIDLEEPPTPAELIVALTTMLKATPDPIALEQDDQS